MMRTQRGFTLIEVMVALFIAATTLAAISTAMQRAGSNAIKLRDQTLAMYIASNAIAELRIGDAFPDTGTSSRDLQYANREWLVRTVVTESGIEGLRRVDVSVADQQAPDRFLRTVAGFVSSGTSLPPGSVPDFSGVGAQP